MRGVKRLSVCDDVQIFRGQVCGINLCDADSTTD